MDIVIALSSSHSTIRKLWISEIKLCRYSTNTVVGRREERRAAKRTFLEMVKLTSRSLQSVIALNCSWMDAEIIESFAEVKHTMLSSHPD
tara:strand:+ start:688 stop:957 length:270 start_codon:yes stop_codon:yes gene_type:complete